MRSFDRKLFHLVWKIALADKKVGSLYKRRSVCRDARVSKIHHGFPFMRQSKAQGSSRMVRKKPRLNERLADAPGRMLRRPLVKMRLKGVLFKRQRKKRIGKKLIEGAYRRLSV